MLLIFDWDGTLIDSIDKIIDCMQKAADTSGHLICEADAIRNIIGLGLLEALQCLYPTLNEAAHENIRREYIKHFVEADQWPCSFYDGVLEGLHYLRDNNFLLAIATGKSRRGLNRALATLKMKDFFHGSRCADESVSKPNPQMLSDLLHCFSREAEKAVMIGDTEYDMSMAQQLGMPRVAVSYGAHHVDRLQKYQPQLSITHFLEFVRWVEQGAV